MLEKNEKPIINAHAHIFLGRHVPPYIAKTYLPCPIFYLVNLHWFVAIFDWCIGCHIHGSLLIGLKPLSEQCLLSKWF